MAAGKEVHGMLMRISSLENAVGELIREKKALHQYSADLEKNAGKLQVAFCGLIMQGGGRIVLSKEGLRGVPDGNRIKVTDLPNGEAEFTMIKVAGDVPQ